MEANDDRTPLSPSARDALDHLTPALEGNDETLSRDEALTHLRGGDFDTDLASTALDELLNKGYLYEVNGTLHRP
ncbi:hypothetical protein [Haladaptatus sp. NG-WS-4]